MLFYIKYGCSISHESLIVDANDYDAADRYAERAAQDIYYSYDCNYPCDEDYEDYTEEEISEMEYQDMLNDIYWYVENYDEENEDHIETFKEQNRKPYEV